MGALIVLARTFVSRATRIIAKPIVAGGLGGAAGSFLDDIPGLGFLGGGGGGGGVRRRRRRKMFTNTDIVQFAAAEAIAGKKAAATLMMIRAAKA